MRIFSTILMVLILAMNFKPCADELIAEESGIYTVIESGTEHSSHENDDCSPFCCCACCSVRSLSISETKTVVFLPKMNLQKATFVVGQVHQVSLPIWQPPKLG